MRSYAAIALVAVALCGVAAAAPSIVTMPLTKQLHPAGSRFPGGPAVQQAMSKASLATGSGPVVNPVGGSIWPVSIFWSFIDVRCSCCRVRHILRCSAHLVCCRLCATDRHPSPEVPRCHRQRLLHPERAH